MDNRHLYQLAGFIALTGLLIFAYKAIFLHLPLKPASEKKIWDLEVRLEYQATGKPVKLFLRLPQSNQRYTIEDERFISRGYGLSIQPREGNRRAVWSIRTSKGKQVLYYRGTIRASSGIKYRPAAIQPELPVNSFKGPELVAARSLMEQIVRKSADTDTLVAETLKILNSVTTNNPDEQVKTLLGRQTAPIYRQRLAVRLLALQKMPARVMHGVRLQTYKRNATPVTWLEVYHKKRWHAYNPATGETGIPDDYLAWWSGNRRLASITGAAHLQTRITLLEKQESVLKMAAGTGKPGTPMLYRYSLFSLPVETQAVYKTLMTIPLGVFLLVLFRNLVGLRTFGTFMPVLIALSFRETQLLWGLLNFLLIIGIGLIARFYLGHLRLLVVPRLAAVLLIVITIMLSISIISNLAGFTTGLSIALFPMVIITMTIERMSIVWDERGPGETIRQTAGSLLAATFAYLLMTIDQLEHLMFVFPELILLILSMTLLMGRYTGYRLLELVRFRALARPGDKG